MATAFGEYHSGAAPATGSWSVRTPARLASSATRVRMRVLSTHEPMCSTGGMPSERHALPRDLPARSAAPSCIRPASAQATAAQPVSTTKMLRRMSSLAKVMWPKSCLILGLLQPTIPTAPRTLPSRIRSKRGLRLPPIASFKASTEKPTTASTGALGMSTRSGTRFRKLSTAMATMRFACSKAFSGVTSTYTLPGITALGEVDITLVWKQAAVFGRDGKMHW